MPDRFTWQCWCLPFLSWSNREIVTLQSAALCVMDFLWRAFRALFCSFLPLCWEVTMTLLCWQENRVWCLNLEEFQVRTMWCIDYRKQKHPQQQCLHGTSAAAMYLLLCFVCLHSASAALLTHLPVCVGDWWFSVVEFGIFGAHGWLGNPLHPMHCSLREWAGQGGCALIQFSAGC